MDIFLHLETKRLTGIILLLITFHQASTGYFSELGQYLKSVVIKNYWHRFLLVLAVVLTAFLLDPTLAFTIQSWQCPALDAWAEAGRHFGRNIWPYPAALYLAGLLMRRKNWCRLAFGMLIATALTGLACVLLKFIFLRARPDSHLGAYSFFHRRGLFRDDGSFQSFPSGDVAIAAGAASYIFYTMKNRYLRWLILLIPLGTAFSRIELENHWPSDTLFSIGIGLLIAHFVWSYRKTRFDEPIGENKK